ncbi:MAG: gliding motility-associated C-terminal domain-containing protein [Flavobacteriales bacterium]|nr:gliding motility-associated C-terminal domain-containing protein [Flavobacteriales bacterium]
MRTHTTLATLAVAWMVHAPAWAQPTCSISLGPDATVCAGQTATFTLPAGYSTYLWSTGAAGQSLTTGIAGTYWGQVSYPSGNRVNNGDFNSGNLGFWSQFANNSDLQGEGRYFVGTNANNHHPQLQGTGNGNFLMVNAGFPQQWWYFWSQGVTVCPGQTYTFSFRMMNLANQGPATVELITDWSTSMAQWTAPAAQAVWNTYTTTITTGPNQTAIDLGLRVISNWAVGNDFGIDDISLSGTVNLRDTVVVNVTPLPVVNLGPNVTLCAGDQVMLDATAPGATYLWDNGSTNATRTVSAIGTYSVTVTVNGCSNSDAVDVLVNPLPTVNLGPDVTLCAGDQVTLDATTAGATYLWDNGSTNATRTVSASGTYSVDVTVNGCTASDAVDVLVNPLPTVTLGPDLTLCAGDQITLDATTPGGTYLWDNGSTAATRTVSAAGTYSVDVTVNGCTASDAIDVLVNPLPTVNLGPDVTLCAGDQVTLDATTAGATYLWDNGSTGATRTVSAAGTYSVDVTVNGCTASDAIDVLVNPLPTVNLGPDVTLCAGDQVTLDATTAGATYLWDNGSTGATRIVNAAGTYSVDFTVNGCLASDAIDVLVNPLPTVNLGPDVTLCAGDQVTLDATTAGATYLWDNGSTGATRAANAVGTYSVDVTVNGCAASDAIDVLVNPLPTVNLGPDVTLCAGDQVTLDATTAGATYLWDNGSTSATRTVSTASTYSVDVTLNGCTATDAIDVLANPLPTVDLGPDLTLCPGTQALLDATTAGATYLWDNGSTAATRTVNAAGTYSVDVTVNGCTASDAVNVIVSNALNVNLGADVTLCAGDQITLDATTTGATYLWDNGSTNATRTVNASGTYSVDVTVNGCTGSDAVDVVVNPLPVVNIGPDVALCAGDQLTLDATTPGATYLWDNGSTSATRTINTAGTYSVDVTVNGCAGSDAVDVVVNPLPAVNIGPDVTLCAGDQVTLDATTPGATYLWDNGSTTATRAVNIAGTYSVDVTVNGCTASDAATVSVIANPVLNLGPDLTLCPGDQAVIDASTPGAAYLWHDGSTATTYTATGAGAVSCTITVNGCSGSDAVQVVMSPAPTVDLGPDQSICAGDQLVLDATCTGCTYLWDDASTGATRTVNTAGIYSVTATANGCSAADDFVLTVAPAPVVNLGADIDLCPGATTLVDATTPGATYLWHDGSTGPAFTAIGPGAVAVTVSIGSCSANDALTVNAINAPTVDLGNDTTLCPGELITLDLTGSGASIVWQDGSTGWTYTTAATGTYSATVTGANGCTAQDAIDVLIATPSAVDLGPDATLCSGSTLVLDATLPGATYLWSDGTSAPTLPATASGLYWVQVSQGSCSVSDTITLTFLPTPAVDLGPDLTLCDGTPTTFDATTPGASYLWHDGSTAPTFTTTSATTVSVTVTLGPCAASDAAVITVIPLPAVDLGPDQTLCAGAVVSLDATLPGATYQWQDGSTGPTYSATTTGTYSVAVLQNGCMNTDAMTLTVVPLPNVELGLDTSLCLGGSLVLAPSVGSASVLWSTGSTQPSLTVNTSGTYWIAATANGCSASDTITATFIDLSALELGPNVTLCPGEVHTFSVNVPGATISWPDGSSNPSWSTSTAGTVVVTASLGGCARQDAAQVSVVAVPQNTLGDDAVLCADDTLVLVAPSGLTGLSWSTGATTDTLWATQPGTYTLSATFQGCPFAESITVSTEPVPSLELGRDVEACEGQQVVLEALASGTVLWSTGAEGHSIAVNGPGLYWASVEGACGSVTDSVRVIISDCGPYIYVPNAFTPDNDGMNDVFVPSVTGHLVQVTLDIFDRWGERIITRELDDLSWDGTVSGLPAPDGVYPWVLRYKAMSSDGVRQERLTGHVTLLR